MQGLLRDNGETIEEEQRRNIGVAKKKRVGEEVEAGGSPDYDSPSNLPLNNDYIRIYRKD